MTNPATLPSDELHGYKFDAPIDDIIELQLDKNVCGLCGGCGVREAGGNIVDCHCGGRETEIIQDISIDDNKFLEYLIARIRRADNAIAALKNGKTIGSLHHQIVSLEVKLADRGPAPESKYSTRVGG